MDRTWLTATEEQYDDDTNLAARQAAFGYLTSADPFPAPFDDFAVLAGRTVLDVGCGNGKFLSQVAAGGARVIGLDLSPGMLAAAAEAAPGTPLVQAEATSLPVADDSIDVTLALWMLYHVPDKPAAVLELRRVTRPDGYAVVSTNTGTRSFLDDLVGDALEAVLGHPVDSWTPKLGFDGENGAAILGHGFDDVTTHAGANRFDFTDTEVIVRYVGSMLGPVHAQNGPFDDRQLLREVGERAANRIAEHGSVALEQRRAVFICR